MSVAARIVGRGPELAGAASRFIDLSAALRGTALASAIGVLAMGLIVLTSWHAQLLAIGGSVNAPMPYNSALAFAVGGLALLLILSERWWLARAAALAVLVLGAVAGGAYLLDRDTRIAQMLLPAMARDAPYAFHMAPTTALGFVLSGSSLWLLCGPASSWRRMAGAGVIASVLFALGAVPVVGFLGNLEAAFAWRDLTLMSGLAAAGFTGLAPGLFAAAVLNDPERGHRGLRWLPWAVGTGLSALAVVLWLALQVEHREALQHTSMVETQAAAHDVESALRRRIESVTRMARRWEVRGGTPREEWLDEAGQYLRHLDGVVAMGWADAAGRVRWLAPESAAARRNGYEGHVKAFEQAAGEPGAPGITTDVDAAGGPTLALHVPLIVAGARRGTITALHDAHAFFDGVLESRLLETLRLSVFDESGRLLYRSSGDATGDRDIAGRHTISFAGRSWRLVAEPTPALLEDRNTLLPSAVLVTGILLAGLVAACMRLLQVAEWRKTSLAELNQGLEERISQRTAELQQAQRELKQAYDTERVGRRRLRFLLDSLAEGIYAVDADGHCTYCNAAGERILGYRRDEMLGRNMHRLIHHTRADGTPYPIEECTVYQSIFHGEGTHVDDELLWRSDGTSFHAEYWSLPIRDDDGNLLAGVVTFFDVSERRHARERLEQRYRQQAAVAELGIAALRGDEASLMQTAAEVAAGTLDVEFAKVLELLPEGEQLRLLAGVGWKPGSIGRTRVDGGRSSQAGYTLSVDEPVVVMDLAAETRFGDAEFLRDHGVVSGMSTIIHGRAGPWGVLGVHSARPRRFDQADVAFLQSVANLIGYALQGAQAAGEIRALNDDLERRVLRRTAELQAANRELEGFSYSVSHDLRSPLRAIDGFAEVLLEDHSRQLDAEGRRVLGVIQRNVTKMGRLIDELLQFSRLSRRELARSAVDMTALVREALGEALQHEPDRCVEVDLEDLPPTVGDPLLLRQVWSNLISNAVKYTRGRDKATIRIRGEQQGNLVRYVVSDNGVGFDMAFADKLFGVFQRLHRESEFEGTGVGLALVQRIVARHGGEIEGTGALDAGAEFTFTLPGEPHE